MASPIKVRFNPALFSKVYWHIEQAFKSLLVRFIWVYGGSSASKTFSVVQLTIKEMLEGPDNNSLVLRKFHVDIKDSIYQDFKNIIAAWELDEFFIIQQDYVKCKTGSYVRFRGLDDSEKVKGISGYKRIILEEISQFDETDLKQIRKRLRGREGQQIVGLFNPISEDHWIKAKIFDTEELEEVPANICGKWINKIGNLVILKTNYLDNKYIVGGDGCINDRKYPTGSPEALYDHSGGFVDQHTIDDFEKDKLTDFAYYQIYGLGNWGRIRTGGEFWKDFNPNLHLRSNKYSNGKLELYQPDDPIHMCWDENVNPYLTCTLWQIRGKTVVQIDEICLEDPRNRVKHVCAEFRKRYPAGGVKGLYVYGDRTSIKEDTKLEKGENFFTEILSLLVEYHPKLRMQSVNPSVVQSGGFINECYAGRQPITVLIGDNCRRSIHDYTYALEDSDGTLKKTKKKNPVTEIQYEEFGHCSDTKRYLITTAFPNEYQTYLRGNKAQTLKSGRRTAKHGY